MEFEEELLDSIITANFTKKAIEPTNWKVFKIEVYKTVLNKTVLTLHVKAVEPPANTVYYERIRLYSPWIPVAKDLNELVGSTVRSIKAMCMVRNIEDERPIFIGQEIRLIKPNNKKCNISTTHEDEKSPLIDLEDDYYPHINIYAGDIHEMRGLMAKRSLSEKEYIQKYFKKANLESCLKNIALEEYLDELDALEDKKVGKS